MKKIYMIILLSIVGFSSLYGQLDNLKIVQLDNIDGFYKHPLEPYISNISVDNRGADNITIQIRGSVPSNVVNSVRNSIANAGCDWLIFEGAFPQTYHKKYQAEDGSDSSYYITINTLKFKVLRNTTINPRVVLLYCADARPDAYNGKAIVQSPGTSSMELFQLSCENLLSYPGFKNTIRLSGSETGVEYVLLNYDREIMRLMGTGEALDFTGDLGGGYFQVMALRDTESEMMLNDIIIEYYDAVKTKTVSFEKGDFQFPAEGGSHEIKVYYLSLGGAFFPGVREMVDSWQRGECITLGSDIRIVDRRHYLELEAFTIELPPNTSDTTRIATMFFGENQGYITRKLFLIQPPVDKIKVFSLSSSEKTYPGEPFGIRLSGSQPGVIYRLYKNGIQVKELNGTGDVLYFTGLIENGPYSAKAFRGNEVVNMAGSVVHPGYHSGNANLVRVEDCKVNTNYGSYKTVFFDGLNRPVLYNSTWVDEFPAEEWLNFDLANRRSNYGEFEDYLQDWNRYRRLWYCDRYLPVTYDTAGRESRQYRYIARPMWQQSIPIEEYYQQWVRENYGGNIRPYKEITYDNSPEDQITTITEGGYEASVYQSGRADFKFETGLNSSADLVKRFRFNGSGVTLDGYHPASTLIRKSAINQEQRSIVEFYDVEEKLIARKESPDISTYYIYDDLGNLRYVIPPLMDSIFTAGSKTFNQLAFLCFYYEYDENGRVYKKNVPGAGITTYLYNKKGNVVLVQDANMASESVPKWRYVKYDSKNRPVIEGLCTGTEAMHREALEQQTIFTESPQGINNDFDAGWTLGYSNRAYPRVDENQALTVYFYDTYDWVLNGMQYFQPLHALGKGRSWGATGLTTGIRERVLRSNGELGDWLTTTYYYDDEYNLVQRIQQQYPYGTEIASFLYNNRGKVIHSRVMQNVHPLQTLVYDRYYDYNAQDQITRIKQKIAGDEKNGLVTLATYWYSLDGTLEEKWLHNHQDTVYYSYDFNGNVESVKSRPFSYWLRRENPQFGEPRYDGNISEVTLTGEMITPSPLLDFKTYTYGYDQSGKLTSADNLWSDSRQHFSYDRNGNLRSFKDESSRLGTKQIVMNYGGPGNGNALIRKKVDFTSRYDGNSTNTYTNYCYDENGNMTHDAARGIDIYYNILNLPRKMGNITYTYTSTGRKLEMMSENSYSKYVGEVIYGNHLISLSHPEGMVKFRESSTQSSFAECDYWYYFKNHLGSVYSVVEYNDHYDPGYGHYGFNVNQVSEYTPYGEQEERYHNLHNNKILFTGKEVQDGKINGDILNLYDFGARYYDPSSTRWLSIDPLSEKYYSVSPYVYCVNDPVNFIDPDGRSTFVVKTPDGRYKVVGGDLTDGDDNIYVITSLRDLILLAYGFQTGTILGKTMSMTSFYDTDENTWAFGSIIDGNDKSGEEFLGDIISERPSLLTYMWNARNKQSNDFKSRGTYDAKEQNKHFYRGMSIGTNRDGIDVYASARDIGNYAAGFVAGDNNLSWKETRLFFDGYQSWVSGGLKTEGLSSKIPQWLGWSNAVILKYMKWYILFKNSY